MDVVAGKGGNFFVVTGRVNNVILSMLSEISYDEFVRYNAYSTMKKISRQSCAEYAAQNGLRERVLENFSRLEEVIDYHATQDLMYFIESEDSRDRSDSFDNDIVVDPANYSNGFLHAAPREVSGLITDSFQIPEEQVPRILKSVGISIKRETLSHFVKWSSVTYKVDIVPARKQSYCSRFDNKSITVVENCYVFEPDDWKNIKKIEDMSLNAWPSHKMELYDGWILRFSYFYTHRTNSVEQFGNSTLTWREKIPYCESVYKRLGTPAVFKISPLVSPDFDYVLENRGYAIQHTTNVMAMSMNAAHLDTPYPDVTFYNNIPSEWIESLFNLKNTINPIHRKVVPSMYQAILKETICACIRIDGQIIATGLGILDRDYIGIYAIHVKEEYRKHGYARQICTGLLKEGMKKGAQNAYLQVVEGNDNARALYRSLGFQQLYTYWFRVQPDENGNFPPEK